MLPIKIPLAICFALGAALAPTDAVAFLSLANRLKFPNRVKNILTSEGLLNDASSLVAFQFALTAFLTGTFSLAGASLKLALTIFGGIAVGLLFALLNRIFFISFREIRCRRCHRGFAIRISFTCYLLLYS
nr:cation:proton antiporter [Streptococcus uberis]